MLRRRVVALPNCGVVELSRRGVIASCRIVESFSSTSSACRVIALSIRRNNFQVPILLHSQMNMSRHLRAMEEIVLSDKHQLNGKV